jgi:hypothetical protein
VSPLESWIIFPSGFCSFFPSLLSNLSITATFFQSLETLVFCGRYPDASPSLFTALSAWLEPVHSPCPTVGAKPTLRTSEQDRYPRTRPRPRQRPLSLNSVIESESVPSFKAHRRVCDVLVDPTFPRRLQSWFGVSLDSARLMSSRYITIASTNR